MDVCIYIYIYIYTRMHIYIYIYIIRSHFGSSHFGSSPKPFRLEGMNEQVSLR